MTAIYLLQSPSPLPSDYQHLSISTNQQYSRDLDWCTLVKRAMSSGDVISWYAYQDPKSGREYFHEPVSGKTSWVLPTSRNSQSDGSHRSNKAGSSGDKSARLTKPTVASPHYLMSAVGITIVFILVFNTLFLLVLVKVLRENNELKSHASNVKVSDDILFGQIVDAWPESTREVPVSSIKQNDLDNQTLCSTIHAALEVQEVHHSEPAPAIKETNHDDSDPNDVSMNVGKLKNQLTRHKGNNVVRERAEIEDNRLIPMRCWIPFSYILLRKCRQQARAGFPMPLANVEHILLI